MESVTSNDRRSCAYFLITHSLWKRAENHTVETLSGKSYILLYQTEDNRQRLEVILDEDTVWLNQKQIAELFQVGVNAISYHVSGIFKDKEVIPEATFENIE